MTIQSALHSMAIALMALAAAHPASAQFKVVEPDGRITYTDRPPPSSSAARVTTLGRSGATPLANAPGPAAAADASLPLELRQAVARFPVTLYTMSECESCEQARRLLRERGVPHTEKTVGEFGADELLRLTGARSVPTLSIGAQMMRGYGESDWHATLDLAGYPRESRLPRNYVHAAATPLVAPPSPAPSRSTPPPAPVEIRPPVIAEPPPGEPSIRF